MMSLIEKALRYQRIHGTRKLITESLARLQGRRQLPLPPGAPDPASFDETGWVNIRELVNLHHSPTWPLRLFSVPSGEASRVSLVTDSINRGSLYGGVGTAMILAALLAESRRARLRIVTRVEKAHPAGLECVLKTNGIELSQEVEFAHAPFHDIAYEIDLLADELFLTTSWWSTAATLGAVPAESVLYLLQEDERMFYPYGDEHLRCSRVLENPNLRFVVNSRLLYDHLADSGLSHMATRGMWFEPAFPSSAFYPRVDRTSAKRTLMLYARPNNLRNLFMFGLELLETAITRGILRLDEWDIILVGKEIPKLRFDDGRYSPKRIENLSWAEYAELAGRVDLGVCLMYTPHPSYPPLDLAASGAVVLTNTFGPKQTLDQYSKNIICADLSMPSMLAGLAEGVRLACSAEERHANHQGNGLGRDWRESFTEILRRVDRNR